MGDAFTLFFLHIPKCAGTSLRHMLISMYGLDAVAGHYPGGAGWPTLAEVRAKIGSRPAVMCGHYAFGVHAEYDGYGTCVTMLRDPVERVVSHYYHHRRNKANKRAHEAANNLGLAEFTACREFPHIDNLQVRMLSGIGEGVPFGTIGAEEAAAAKTNLEGAFAAFGIVERFVDSTHVIAHALRWPRIPTPLWANQASNRPAEISEYDREALEALLQPERELYDWATERFERSW